METHRDQICEFDVVYSNNVFEHLEDPFCAARNIWGLCREGGLIVTVVPFAQRHHESPNDYFRYTNRGIEKLFEVAGGVTAIESGYDIIGRRNNWQGSGLNNDIVPKDNFGAWRETWFTVCVLQKNAK
jgi:SAM-dependent methyltransferase